MCHTIRVSFTLGATLKKVEISPVFTPKSMFPQSRRYSPTYWVIQFLTYNHPGREFLPAQWIPNRAKVAKIRFWHNLSRKKLHSHIFSPIGQIFGYVVAPIVCYLLPKFQPSTSFTFGAVIYRANPRFFGKKCQFRPSSGQYLRFRWNFACRSRIKCDWLIRAIFGPELFWSICFGRKSMFNPIFLQKTIFTNFRTPPHNFPRCSYWAIDVLSP